MLRTRNEPCVPVRNQRPLALRGCMTGKPEVIGSSLGRTENALVSVNGVVQDCWPTEMLIFTP